MERDILSKGRSLTAPSVRAQWTTAGVPGTSAARRGDLPRDFSFMRKRSRYSEEQIIGSLTEDEAGANCAGLCRAHGMSEGTFYAWKAKFGGMPDG